jgi:hypothetical protein
MAVGEKFTLLHTHFFRKLINGLHVRLGRGRYLPVFHGPRIKFRSAHGKISWIVSRACLVGLTQP